MARDSWSFVVLIAFSICGSQAEIEYADTFIAISEIQMAVDGLFSGTSGANLTLDVKLIYGNPLLTQLNRSTRTVQLFTDGPQQHSFPAVYFTLQNPLDFIHAIAIAGLKFFSNGTQNEITQDLFVIQSYNWSTPGLQFINTTFDQRQSWYINMKYQKQCAIDSYYGFSCNVQCPKPITAVECYDCNPVNGTKTCCKDPDYDQNTCYRHGANHTRPLTCEEQLQTSQNDVSIQKKWRVLYFWLMIGFIVLAILFLAIILCCLFGLLYYKRKASESKSSKQSSYPPSVVQPTSTIQQSNSPVPAPYTEAYNRSLRRKERGPSIPLSPERRRRAISISSAESLSNQYPSDFYYQEKSPRQRRRIEQVV
ncbi:hypothetical protein M3Y96_00847500 [Aphelenchoides besseyi]|nr:hypothetical protein M3Y96_00847500 [Aphelenchoides besseyi]